MFMKMKVNIKNDCSCLGNHSLKRHALAIRGSFYFVKLIRPALKVDANTLNTELLSSSPSQPSDRLPSRCPSFTLRDVAVTWVIRDGSISSTFVDPGAAEFLLPQLERRAEQKPAEGTPAAPSKRWRYHAAGQYGMLLCFRAVRAVCSTHVMLSVVTLCFVPFRQCRLL